MALATPLVEETITDNAVRECGERGLMDALHLQPVNGQLNPVPATVGEVVVFILPIGLARDDDAAAAVSPMIEVTILEIDLQISRCRLISDVAVRVRVVLEADGVR